MQNDWNYFKEHFYYQYWDGIRESTSFDAYHDVLRQIYIPIGLSIRNQVASSIKTEIFEANITKVFSENDLYTRH